MHHLPSGVRGGISNTFKHYGDAGILRGGNGMDGLKRSGRSSNTGRDFEGKTD